MATRSASETKKSQRYLSTKRAGKKPLPDPTHVGHFISILIMTLCKKVLHIDPAVKIGVYLCGVLVGSVFSDVVALPKTIFSDKRNIMNRLYKAFGFGWTFTLLTLFILMTSFVYTCGDWKVVIRKHLLRLGIATIWCIAFTKTFTYVDSVVGICSLSKHKQKHDCLKAGEAWLGFKISGHVFLLMHYLLTISEEVKSFKCWAALESLLKDDDLGSKKNLTEREISQARVSYKYLTPYIKITVILLAMLTVFCEFMLIITVVYRFHTFTQKITAAFLAVGCWFVTYRIISESNAYLLPSQPGQSRLNYMKCKQSL